MRSRDWISARFTALAITIAVLVAGSAFRWTQALVAIVVLLAIAPLLQSRRVFERISPLIALSGLAILLTAIQLVPLPHAVLEWLAPVASGLRDDGASLVHTSPWSAITADVPATLRAMCFFVVLLGIGIAALRVATSETGRYWLIAFVAGLCGVAACVTWIHRVLGMTSLYGLITPTQSPHLLCPIINYNSFGCLMAIGTVLAIGLAMFRRQKSWLRVTWVAVVGLCGITTLATLSRGASLALAAGGFVTVGALVAQRWLSTADDVPKRRGGFLTSSLPIAVVAVCTVVVVLYAGAGGVAEQFHNTHLTELNAPRSKFTAWRSSATLIDESPWVGIGRGAFEPVFTRVHPASAMATYAGLENEYLQAVVDWGAPGALLLGFAAIWLVVKALRRWRDGSLAAGALGALAVVLLQSNVDFGVEFFGIAAPITAVVATLVYVPLREASQRELAIARGVRIAHLVALAGAALLLLSSATTTLEEDHVALEGKKDLTLDDVRPALQRHPLDYFGYATAARIMMRNGDRSAIQVLNHALILHPTHPGLHLMAARLLFDAGHPEQATIEYAAALAPTADRRKLLAEIVKRFPPELAARALPIDPTGIDSLAQALDEIGHSDVVIAWLDHVLDIQPQTMHACDVMFGFAVRHPTLAPIVIDDKRCVGFDPSRETRLALARGLLAEKHFEQSARLLDGVETWPGQVDAKLEGWLMACDAQTGLARWDEAKRCLHRLDASGYVPAERETELSSRLERIEQLRADHR